MFGKKHRKMHNIFYTNVKRYKKQNIKYET